jgi:hypothetical protein
MPQTGRRLCSLDRLGRSAVAAAAELDDLGEDA